MGGFYADPDEVMGLSFSSTCLFTCVRFIYEKNILFAPFEQCPSSVYACPCIYFPDAQNIPGHES